MRFLSLEIENWACHDHLEIILRDGLQIEGRNGTGKSSILEAIRFIFARDARKYKNKIKNGTKACRVKLRLIKDNREYEIEKRLFLNKASEAVILLDNAIIADNPTSVYNSLQSILSENILDKLLYVPQGELTRLIDDLNRKGGREELDSLFGLDKFQSVYEGAQKEYSEKKGKYEILYKKFLKYPKDNDKILKNRISEYKKRISTLEKEGKRMELKVNDIKDTIRRIKKKIDEMQRIRKEKEASERRIIELNGTIEKEKREREFLKDRLMEIHKKKKYLEELRGKEKDMVKYSKIKRILDDIKSKEERLPDMDEMECKKRELRLLKPHRKDNLEKQLKEKESKLLGIEREIAGRKQSLSEIEDYLSNLRKLNYNAKCPRCGQKLTKKHLENEIRMAQNKISSIAKEVRALNSKRDLYKTEVKKLRVELEKTKRNETRYLILKDEIEKSEHEAKIIMEYIDKLKLELQREGYRDEGLDFVEKMIEEFNRIRGEIETLKKEVDRENEYRYKINDINRSIFKHLNERKSIENGIKKLEFDDSLFEALYIEKERLQEEEKDKLLRLQRINSESAELGNKVEECEKEINEFLSLKGEVDGAKKEMNLMKEARDEIFHPSRGIRRYYREIYVKRLGQLITYYFRKINNNPKFREISFDKDYNIEIKTTEGIFNLDQLSGGERVQLAVAFRIALIELLSPITLLILDEPFGSLDKEHRETMGEALNRLSLNGQLILVTHIPVDSLNLPKLELEGY